jgi:UDPglucose--hexose-1-phosphate uridylyltransferase
VKFEELKKFPHKRFNPLTREWVLVSAQRTLRPWQGKTETIAPPTGVTYDPACYLCPGNERAGGARNPKYESTFVFENDFPTMLPGAPDGGYNESSLLIARSEAGECRVVCFSPRHDLTIPRMSQAEVQRVVDVWGEEFRRLESAKWAQHVQIFENRGSMMGASNPHPHCQIWANASLPNVASKEIVSFEEYRASKGTCLLCDYVKLELRRNERIVCENDAFLAVVPFWAVWPFEILLLSKRHFAAITDLSEKEADQLAEMLRRITIRYDNLFQTSFPYSMGFHQRPTGGRAHPDCHFHAHYFPPLLRSATVQKFMVGYELLAIPQRDITAESAAERLREAGEKHYLDSAPALEERDTGTNSQ